MRLIVILLIAATLAGCADPEPTKTTDDPPPAAGTGVIRGVVVDEGIATIAGATIAFTSGELATTSDAEGKFEFRDVQPGSHFLLASKQGYQPIQVNVQVVADKANPPATQIKLAKDPAFIQVAQTSKWEGIMNCQVGWNAGTNTLPGIDQNSANPCFALNAAMDDTDRIVEEYVLDATPDYVQSELIWTPSQTLAGYMSVMYTDTRGGGLDNYARASGAATLVIGANKTLLEEHAVGVSEPLIVRVFASNTDPLTVIAQQEFEVFTTTFIGFEPTEGWLYTVDGHAEPPS